MALGGKDRIGVVVIMTPSSPQSMTIGTCERRTSEVAVLRLWGQRPISPSGVFSQS